MKLTKVQQAEILLEDRAKNRSKYISEYKDFKEMSMKDRNQMGSTSPEQYERCKKSYKIVTEEFM